jgi:NTP pyrophosphatase (non-canonical NTP hydrolase)
MLLLNEYQTQSFGTAVYPGSFTESKEAIEYTLFGMLGEAGEIANKYKKILRSEITLGPQEKEMLMDEAGDVLWYLSAFVKELGYSLEEVGQFNIRKLSARKAAGELKEHS